MENETITFQFDPEMYQAALAYYGLPVNYKRVFTKTEAGLIACEPAKAAPAWVQANLTDESFPLKKPKVTDIQVVQNITLDFEYGRAPTIAHEVGSDLVFEIVKMGLAEQGLAVEDSGAGCHIVIPIVPIHVSEFGGAKIVNDSIKKIVERCFVPEFEKIAAIYSLPDSVELGAYNIDRIISVPGTLRPANSKPDDVGYLKNGYLRNWLVPEIGFPIRHESKTLSDLIKLVCVDLQKPVETTVKTQKSTGNSSAKAKVWQSILNTYCERISTAQAGHRHYTLRDYALSVGGYIAGESETVNEYEARQALEAAYSVHSPNKKEMLEAIEWGINRGKEKPLTIEVSPVVESYIDFSEAPLPQVDPATGEVLEVSEEDKEKNLADFTPDDEGNALAFLSIYGKDFLFCDAYGWLSWIGTHWQAECAESALDAKIVEVLKNRRKAGIDKNRESVVKAAITSNSRIMACQSRVKPKVEIAVSQFDCNPDELNVKNGVLNLRTGKLTEHDPMQRFTYCINVNYFKDADYSIWQEFLNTTIGENGEVQKFLQMAIGYGLTGHTSEECLFFAYGPSRSGKGTFTETVMELMGHPLSAEVDFGTFTADRDGDSNNFDLAPLKPSRLVFASESDRHKRLNTSKIKRLTGGNKVYCSFKHKDHFEYRPMYKLFLSSNWPVNGDADDDALWGRVRVIQFPNSHLGNENKQLKGKMKSEANLQGVLRWAIDGAMLWYRAWASGRGLVAPKQVQDWTQEQRSESDNVAKWLEEATELDESYFEPNPRIRESYLKWCTENGNEPKRGKGLADSLRTKGYIPNVLHRDGGRVERGVQGLRVI